MGLLNSAIEEQKKAGLLNRTAGAEPVAPRRVVPATIQAPKQNAVQKVASKAYGLLPSVVRQGVDQVKDALFGNTRDRAVLQDAENKGQPVDFVTRLKVEGFLPFLGKSDEEVISENVVHLTDKGVAPERAEELAFYDRFKGRSMPGLPDEAKTRLDALAPTKDETRVLGIARLGNQLGVVGDAVGILPVGSIAKQGTRLTPRILVKATEETALKTLIKEGIDEGIATKFAPSVAAVKNDAKAQTLLDEIIRTQNELKAADANPLRMTKATKATELADQIETKFPHVSRTYADNLAEDAVRVVKEFGRTPADALRLVNEQILKVPVKVAKAAMKVADEAIDLSKFKTADEFVASRPKVYRGTEEAGPLKESFETDYGDGFYFADKKDTASGYGKIVGEYSVDLKKPLVIKDRYEMNGIVDDFLAKKAAGETKAERVTEYLKSQGYDGIKVKDGGMAGEDGVGGFTIAFDRGSVKDTSELVEQYAKATAATPTPASRGISTKGIQELRQEGKSPSPERVVEAFDNKYTAGDGTPQKLEQSLGDSQITTQEPKLWKRVSETLKGALTSTVEFLQDADKRILDLQRNAIVTDESNIYQKLTLMPGRLGDVVERGRTAVKEVIDDMAKFAKESGTDLAKVRKEVNEYLLVKHAPERNAALGDKAAGISTEDAAKRLKEIESSEGFARVQEFANKLADLNTQTLDMLHDAGVVGDELFDTLRTKYKNHVPLNRLFEEADDVGEVLSGKGLDVRSSGIKRAKGSEREVADIVENIVVNYEQAAIRSEKNIVDQAALKFVRDNPNPALFEIRKPKPIGETFDGRPLMEKTQDPNILQMFENGKPIWIEIKDPHLAVAMRGVGREKLGAIMNAVAAFTRTYSGLATRFNPEFAFPNKLRDLQETMIYLSAQKDVTAKGATKAVLRDPVSLKAITDGIRGIDSEGARLYAEMKRMGGTTGGMGLSTRKKVNLDIKSLEKLATSKPRAFAEGIVSYVDHWNTIFEDSTRLSVYRTALEQGLTKERAAFLAKEASVNFNRMGKGGPVINGLYMFSNASIQGSAKMIRSLRNPKVLAGVTAAVGSSVAAIGTWNDMVDPEWREHVSAWDRLNALPVALPSDDGTVRYITVPVSWGVKPIMVMANYAYDAMAGKGFDGAKASNDIFTAIAEAYNPMGGSDALSAATPTILDIPFEIGRNLSWAGGPIKPDRDPYAPESIKYFDSLEKKESGRIAIGLSEMLSGAGIEVSPADLNYAYEGYISGAGRAVTKFGNTIFGAATGKLPPISEFPFLSRFYKEKLEDEVFNTEANEAIGELMAGDKKEKFYIQKQAEDEWEKLKELTPEEKRSRLKALAQENPDLVEKVLDVGEAEQMGLTGKEKQLKYATVAVRAEFIANEIAKAKTKEERKALILNYREKKILTDSVLDAMAELLPKE